MAKKYCHVSFLSVVKVFEKIVNIMLDDHLGKSL